MMKKICGLFAGAVLALVCGGMLAGCSDDVTYQLSERGHGGRVVGFMDDSLVIVLNKRQWHEYRETWNGVYSEKSGFQDARLCLYNYRVQEDGPRVCDSISGDFSCSGQLADSVLWYGLFGSRSSLFLWKFGESWNRHYSLDVVNDGCGVGFDGARAHEWLDGMFIVIGKQSLSAGNDSCQYAVLDTAERTLTYKRLDENLKWIQKCDDVRAWGEDVYCFMPGEHAFEGRLLRNGNDTVDVPVEFTIGDFLGNILRPNAYLCNFVGDKLDCLDVEWRGGLKFYRGDEVVVEY